jgi:hypothetical protein
MLSAVFDGYALGYCDKNVGENAVAIEIREAVEILNDPIVPLTHLFL